MTNKTARTPIVIEPRFGVGEWVRPVMPDGYDTGDLCMVICIEILCDLAGTRVIYEVRPRNSNGAISGECMRFREQELEEAE